MNLYTITGMSSSGKTSLVNTLLDKYPDKFQRIKTATTRRRRHNETKDDYYFMNEDDFNSDFSMVLKSAFAGHKYGVPLKHPVDPKKDCLIVLDKDGAMLSKSIGWPGSPDVFNVYIDVNLDKKRAFKKKNWRRYKSDLKAGLDIREGYDCVIRNDETLDSLADNFMNYVTSVDERQKIGLI